MNKPRVFIGSSSESLDYAYGVQENLTRTSFPTVWTQGVFKPSQSNLDSLIRAIDDSDFSVFIFSPDDIIIIRDQKNLSVRDNVIFELGLFIGRLGKKRCFIINPLGGEGLHLPTDLIGFNPLNYDENHPNITASLGVACSIINREIKELFEIQKLGNELKNLKLSTKIYSQTNESNEVIESEKGFVKFFINKAKWFLAEKNNPASEFQFNFVKGDLYVTIITERMQIPIKRLVEFAIENINKVSEDYELIKVELRNINGESFVMLDIECTMQEVRFRYRNFYWSGKRGSLQILIYTGISLFDEFIIDIDDFLSGVKVIA